MRGRTAVSQGRINATNFLAALGCGLTLAVAPVAAQLASQGKRPELFDLKLGQHTANQPSDFQEFACGTDGGPPSLRLRGFADFAACPAEASGLHEVTFRYDDEGYYLALASGNLPVAEIIEGVRVGNFPVIVSALFDDSGILRGLRAVTDDRVPTGVRQGAYSMPTYVRSIFGSDGWTCESPPPGAEDQPVAGRMVLEDCVKLTSDGVAVRTQSRLYRRSGQYLVDPFNGQLREGLFISTARVDVQAPPSSIETPPHPSSAPPPTDTRGAFLAGLSRDCPRCELPGADLKLRDLAGADLSGANLAGASLHRASLVGAALDGANLAGANLNLADLKRASLVAADLSQAFLYQTDFGAADLSGAILDDTRAQHARFMQASLVGVSWQNANAELASLAGADLTSANLTGSWFGEADLRWAILVEAEIGDASFFRARLVEADLSRLSGKNADFLEADLTGAILRDAILNGARLLRARTREADFTSATLAGAVLADGRIAE